MAVSFGMFTSHPALLACQLKRLEAQVALEDRTAFNAVGVGSYAQEDVLLQRRPTRSAPGGLSAIAPPEASEALLYQAQLLPATVSLEESAQPFRFRRWLFLFDGNVPGFEGFRADLLAALPPYLRRQIGADTPAEAAFSLFLKELRDTGQTDDRRLEPRLGAELLGRAARALVQLAAIGGAARTAEALLLTTNSQLFLAARLSAQPLFYTLLEGSSQCEACGLLPGRSELEPRVRAHVRARAVAVATHLMPGARWLELGQGQVLAVGPELAPAVVAA